MAGSEAPLAHGTDLARSLVCSLGGRLERDACADTGAPRARRVRRKRLARHHAVRGDGPATSRCAPAPARLAVPRAQCSYLRALERSARDLLLLARLYERRGSRSRPPRLPTALLPGRCDDRAPRCTRVLRPRAERVERRSIGLACDLPAHESPPTDQGGLARALAERALLPLCRARRLRPPRRYPPSPVAAPTRGSGDRGEHHGSPAGYRAARRATAPLRRPAGHALLGASRGHGGPRAALRIIESRAQPLVGADNGPARLVI